MVRTDKPFQESNVPVVTNHADGSVTTAYSPVEFRESIRILQEAAKKVGRDFSKDQNDPRPSVYDVGLVIAWSYSYADPDPLDKSHPAWAEFLARSEWFRAEVLKELRLPSETTWEVINRRAGVLVESEYQSEMEWAEAYCFGQMTRLTHKDAIRKYDEFEEFKYKNITHRV